MIVGVFFLREIFSEPLNREITPSGVGKHAHTHAHAHTLFPYLDLIHPLYNRFIHMSSDYMEKHESWCRTPLTDIFIGKMNNNTMHTGT